MKIVLEGVETNNKGAELMLYAILQEIERRFPYAQVYMSVFRVRQGFSYLRTSLSIKGKPISVFEKWCIKFHIWRLIRFFLGDKIFDDIHCISDSSYFIDASGLFYSDQWKHPTAVIEQRAQLLKDNKRKGCRNIFLPQAFGPITHNNIKKAISDLDKYADLVIAREKTSLRILEESGLIRENKLRLYPDFTNLVNGIVPVEFAHLNKGVCIIPNVRMLDKSELSFEKYNDFIQNIIKISYDKGLTPYLLNHEGSADGNLARKIQSLSEYSVDVVDNLNALEIKGLISTAYLVISSRYHGAVSALNSCVPCLATSWSHKYEELFNDYSLSNCVLSVTDIAESMLKVRDHLEENRNIAIRNKLAKILPNMKKETKKMWNEVWNVN